MAEIGNFIRAWRAESMAETGSMTEEAFGSCRGSSEKIVNDEQDAQNLSPYFSGDLKRALLLRFGHKEDPERMEIATENQRFRNEMLSKHREKDESVQNECVATNVSNVETTQEMTMPDAFNKKRSSAEIDSFLVSGSATSTTQARDNQGLDPEAKLMEAASFLENDKVNTNVMPQQDSDQSDMVENEVSIFLLEPSLRIDEMQYALLDNSSSQLLCNDSRDVHILGVGFASKVEQIYILDVDMRGCSKKKMWI
ncbi:hypothetical protein Bca101_041616 [Brassica carinata]